MKSVKRGTAMNKLTKMRLGTAALSFMMINSVMAEMPAPAKGVAPPPPGPYVSQMKGSEVPAWVQQQRQNAPQPPVRPDWARPPAWMEQQMQQPDMPKEPMSGTEEKAEKEQTKK